MNRLRGYDIRTSGVHEELGLCQGDSFRLFQLANRAERRLLMAPESGDEGWYGTWAEILFTLTRTTPYWTAPRNIARLQSVNVCNCTRQLNNQFFEYLRFGNGRFPKSVFNAPGQMQVYGRNNVVTFVNLTSPPQLIAVYPTDPADVGSKRVLIGGIDGNNSIIYSQDGGVRVEGEFVSLAFPFGITSSQYNVITGIQKDVTSGQVQFFQVDPVTSAQTLLLTMEPGETTASYRRYYFNNLPNDCCNGTTANGPVTVTALAKLDHVDVTCDTDYFVLTNLEALIAEMASVRYSQMDTEKAKIFSAERHKYAIRQLVGELTHYLGEDNIAVNFAPFGSARLERVNIGMM